MPWSPSTFQCLKVSAILFDSLGEHQPRIFPSNMMTTLSLVAAEDASVAPSSATRRGTFDVSIPWVMSLHLCAKWFRRPQGEPSGVCTGHRNPQDSGRSFRTVVVLSCAKKLPRCTMRKWLINRRKLSFSATTVKPDVCCKSKPEGLCRFPVDMKYSNALPMFSLVLRKMAPGKSFLNEGEANEVAGLRLKYSRRAPRSETVSSSSNRSFSI